MKNLFFVLVFLVITEQGQISSKTDDKERTARKFITEYLSAFNATGDDKMRQFLLRYASPNALKQAPVEQQLQRFHQMKERLESLAPVQIMDVSEKSCAAQFKSKSGGVSQFEFLFESNFPSGLMGIRVMDVTSGGGREKQGSPKLNDGELTKAVGNYLEKLVSADEFSGVVLVAKDHKPIFFKAFGMMNQEQKIPNVTDTKFNIGSINKSFTKMAIYQLMAKNKVALTDPIKKFLPDYPNKTAAEKVTINHLLTMTSGIGDFFGERYNSYPKEKLRTMKDFFPLFADKPLEFEPGTKNRYSNGGYTVLGAIIEQVSGMDYYTYVREHIFKPAGMLETDSYEKDADIANRALGYTTLWGKPRKNNYEILPGRGSSAGGGYSTAGDLLKYTIALEKGTLIAPEAQGGLGIAGGAPGLNAALEWVREKGYVIVVLSNYDPPSAEKVAMQIRDWLPQ